MAADATLVVIRLILAVVFIAAATAKFIQLNAFRQSLVEFGVRWRIAVIVLSVFIPLAEGALGAAMLPISSVWWASIGLLLVLTLFTVVIAINLAKGRRPPCNCFGEMRARPIGVTTIVRNVILGTLVGTLIVAGPGYSLPASASYLMSVPGQGWLTFWAGIIGLGALGTMAWLIVQLLRQQGRLLLRIDGLEMRLGNLGIIAASEPPRQVVGLTPGSRAPAFSAQRLEGGVISLDELRQTARPIVLLFSDPNCAPCTALVPLLVKWYDEYAERATILIVTRGAPSEIRGKLAGLEQRLGNVLVQKDREIAALFQANATPSAVLINPIGLVVSHLAQGGKEIMELISRLPAEIADPPSRKERQALRQGRAAVTTNAAFVPDALTDG